MLLVEVNKLLGLFALKFPSDNVNLWAMLILVFQRNENIIGYKSILEFLM